jgi:UDP:flavonoid glycosyltransferase YjiC (YdhE family)
MPEPLVGFFPAFANLAESTRLVRIAGQYRALGGRLVLFSHGGEYEELAEKADLPVHRVEPIYTREQFDELMRYDRMEKFGDPFPVPWLIEHVCNESRAYKQHGVSLVVTGFNLPCSLSARKAGVPLVWILAGTAFPAYFEAGLATLPDNFDNVVTRLLPERLTRWLTSRIALRVKTGTRAFNTVARRFGLPRFPNVLSLWTGEYTLISDLPEALDMPPQYDYPKADYIGPLLANLDMPLSPEIEAHLRRPGRHIYFSMGSSGEKGLYLRVLRALGRTGHNVVSPYTTILNAEEIPRLGDHVLLRKLVPGERINRMVDLAVLHGGQGTVYTAAYAGRPVIGIPMQVEQQYNIDMLVRNGSAIRIAKTRFREKQLIAAIDTILGDYERFRGRAEALAKRLPVVDGARRGAERIREIVEESSK